MCVVRRRCALAYNCLRLARRFTDSSTAEPGVAAPPQPLLAAIWLPGHSARRFAIAGLAIAAAAALTAACGSSSSPPGSDANLSSAASESVSAAPPTDATTAESSPAATQMLGNVPSQPYIALCAGSELVFLDPETGATLGKRPLTPIRQLPGGTAPDGSSGTFTPTGYAEVSMVGPSSCADLSWNDDLTAVAGLDHYPNSDTVPASMDVTLGQVTDAIDPPDHTSFDATAGVTYIDAEFNPYTGAMWSVRNLDAGCAGEELHGPDYTKVISHDTVCDRDVARPLIVFDGPTSKLPGVAAKSSKYHNYSIDGSLLPTSNYGVGIIRRSDSGQVGAFVAFNTSDRSQPPMLYTVPASGGEPTKVADLTDFDTAAGVSDVIRYHDS